jgi:hypothetical protein
LNQGKRANGCLLINQKLGVNLERKGSSNNDWRFQQQKKGSKRPIVIGILGIIMGNLVDTLPKNHLLGKQKWKRITYWACIPDTLVHIHI